MECQRVADKNWGNLAKFADVPELLAEGDLQREPELAF